MVWAAATRGSLLCRAALCEGARREARWCEDPLCDTFFILFLLGQIRT
jgi:hypothetical protein